MWRMALFKKMLLYTVAIDIGVNFINILHTIFLYERHFGSFFYVHVNREKLPKQRLSEKFVRKMLMKLTTDRPQISRPYETTSAYILPLLIEKT